jgi:membrane protein DedA with SNARE-associated domain
MAAALATIFDSLRDLSDSPVFYLVIFVIAVLDSVLPIVPSETMVIIGGVAAGLGDLNIVAVIAVGACGAFLGDNMSFEIGLRAKDAVTRWYGKSEKRAKRLAWADDQIEERGGLLLITARFIPGGRTLLTLSCGITGQSHRWFAKWVGTAAVIWASYAALLGYIGGKTFEDNHTLAFVVAFTSAVSITVLIEVVRHVRNRRK